MRILSGKKLLFDKVRVCDSFLSKGLGLMFRRKPLEKGECLLFVFDRELPPALLGIHMNFCLFPIKVAWLDSDRRVVDCQIAEPASFLKPATLKLHKPRKPAKYIIECSPGVRLASGQRLSFRN
ncbi:MAG: DUF192 domain-containing protein [archaeon]